MTDVLVLIGTEKSAFILKSDEKREEWNLSAPLIKGWKISDLQLDSRTSPSTLWAAVNHYVYGPTVQRSRDLGQTWEQIEHGPKFPEGHVSTLNDVWSIVPGRSDEPDVLYAGVADAALFKTDDGGDTWSEVTGLTEHPSRSEWEPGAGGLCCHSIIPHPTNQNRIWVAISAVGVMRSDDGGTTWQVKNTGLPITIEGKEHKDVGSCVHRMVMDPTNPDRLFQQNHQGVYKSDNAGDSWEPIESGLPVESCFGFPMVIHPRNPDTLFISPQESDEFRFARDGELATFKSTDAGKSWQPKTKGLPDNTYVGVMRQAMAVDKRDPLGVYFGTTGGQVFASRDEGESWTQLPFTLPRICSVATAEV